MGKGRVSILANEDNPAGLALLGAGGDSPRVLGIGCGEDGLELLVESDLLPASAGLPPWVRPVDVRGRVLLMVLSPETVDPGQKRGACVSPFGEPVPPGLAEPGARYAIKAAGSL